jgi:fermentation-respiration switch protein FrsA (DUF1100 family)
MLKKICVSVLITYLAVLILMTVFQRSFIYHPSIFENYDQSKLNQINAIVVNDQNLEWLFLPAYQSTNRILVYFHGNGWHALGRANKADRWRQNGYNVVLAEYPGYGTNAGSPSEQSFYDSARVTINKTLSDFPNTELYFYGESIGSGVAVQMATEYDERAVIIEGGFSSLTDVAWNRYPFLPVPLLLEDKFYNISKINDIGSKIAFIHGVKDKTVPYRFSKKIYDQFDGDKLFITLDEASHNNKYDYFDIDSVMSFLK